MMTKPLTQGVALGALMLLAAAGFKYAEAYHLIGPDVGARGTQVVIGAALAFYANFMPKSLSSSKSSPQSIGRMQSVLRFGGWSFALSGLAYAVLWAFAPLPLAHTGSIVAVASAMVVTLGYAAWTCATRRASA